MTDEQIAKSMDYKNLFASECGQKVLQDLDRKCLFKKHGIYDPINERQTCFNLGMHEVILYIHQEIDRDLTKTEDKKAVHKEI